MIMLAAATPRPITITVISLVSVSKGIMATSIAAKGPKMLAATPKES